MEKSLLKGKFIVFEGLDGAGQSTQVSLLAARLTKDGHKVHVTKEPTNNLIGGIIRGALTSEWKPSNRILQMLYAADRGHHLEREILPALSKGFVVICDRYYYSSMAYGSLDLPLKWLQELNAAYPEPDYAFYIQVSPHTSLARMQANRYEMELFEKEKELTHVAETYKKLLKKFPALQAVNGERDVEVIHDEIYKLVAQALNGSS